MSARPTDAERFRELLGRITTRDRWLLAMLAEHTVLTTSQLLRLGWARGRRATQQRTRTLSRTGILDRFRPLLPRGQGTAPWHLLLGPHGAAALAAETGHTVTEIGYRGRARALSVAHRMTLAHDIATHDLITDLAADRHRPDTSDSGPARRRHVELAQWWSAARCRRCFGHHARPDAYLCLSTPDPRTGPTRHGAGRRGWWEMFLEYDTGSESLPRLAAKLAGYHDLAAATGIITPVGFWIARPGREPGARHALADALRALPHPHLVPVLTAAPHPTTSTATPGLDARTAPTGSSGATGRVWLPVSPSGRHGPRVTLADLAVDNPVRPHIPPAPDRPDDPTQPARPDRVDFGQPPAPGAVRDTSVLPAPRPVPPPWDGRG